MLRNYIVGLATVVLIPNSLTKKRYPRVACPLTSFFAFGFEDYYTRHRLLTAIEETTSTYKCRGRRKQRLGAYFVPL